MKAISRLLCIPAILLGMPLLHAETPTQAADRIWNAWMKCGPQADAESVEKFRMIVKTVDREQGTAIIASIMQRSKDWQGEEVLVYVSTVAFLPHEKVLSILNHYKADGKPWEQQCATDLLIELDSTDVKEMVAKYGSA